MLLLNLIQVTESISGSVVPPAMFKRQVHFQGHNSVSPHKRTSNSSAIQGPTELPFEVEELTMDKHGRCSRMQRACKVQQLLFAQTFIFARATIIYHKDGPIKLKAKTCLTTSLSCFLALSFPLGFKSSILDPSYSVDWSPIIFWGACPLRDHLKGKMLLSKLFGQMAVSRKQTNLPVIRWCQNIREIKGRLSRKWSATPLGCFRRAFYPHLLPQCV